MVTSPKNVALYGFFLFNCILMLTTAWRYQGDPYIYILFSLLLNMLLYLGLTKNSIFFDTFIGGLFWLGYWLKFSVRTSFMEGRFHEFVGYFGYTGSEFDHALLATSVGISGLVIARLVRGRYLFSYVSVRNDGQVTPNSLVGLREFYTRNRSAVLTGFVVAILGVSLTNAYFGIYQRGSVPRTVLPYGLGGVYTWLLLFGFASISAILLQLELTLRERIPYIIVLIVLLELLCSNVSMLSRGMILNGTALIIGVYVFSRIFGIRFRIKDILISVGMFVLVFFASTIFVNHVRNVSIANQFEGSEAYVELQRILRERARFTPKSLSTDSTVLFLDRWVGIEGILAVSSYPGAGWDLWDEAWREQYKNHGASLYDIKIAKSPVAQLDLSDYHFISMPGILGFFYYPGSYLFLFVALLLLGGLGAGIEILTFRLGGGNLILCALIGFVVAYRFAHFGYVPSRSYLLFGAIILNVVLVYLANRIMMYRYRLNPE